MQVTTQVTPVTNTSNVTANIAIDHSQVDLWQADPAVWRKPEQIAYLRSLLQSAELRIIDQICRQDERHHKLVARALLRSVLAQYTGVPALAVQLGTGLQGKPYLESPVTNLQFNLSHTQGRIVLAICQNRELGVDVETVRPARTRVAGNNNLNASYLSCQEQQLLQPLGGLTKQQRLCDFWSVKESFVKASGAGLTMPLHTLEVALPTDNHQQVQFSGAATQNSNWRSWLWRQGDYLRQALTIRDEHAQATYFRTFHFFPKWQVAADFFG
ncbi:MAG: 4'-phosphopantetheinyl transferase superfamily protein [Gammaproteobacteria bacterium]|jgi:4'-phosphopantetheinyl transferase|nr:4'-phosphopantetheinyl transferase superfamily protein [Gammaproteobacteria bacterium]